jgi:hypothetical protein
LICNSRNLCCVFVTFIGTLCSGHLQLRTVVFGALVHGVATYAASVLRSASVKTNVFYCRGGGDYMFVKLPSITSPFHRTGDRWMDMERRWNGTVQAKTEVLGDKSVAVPLSAAQKQYWLQTGRRGEKQGIGSPRQQTCTQWQTGTAKRSGISKLTSYTAILRWCVRK